MDLRSLIAEIQRRHVGRVAGVYAVAGWALIQAADTVLPLLGAPEWVPRVIVLAILAGFPVAVALAWVYDLTASGIRRTPDLTDVAAAVPRPALARSMGFFGVGILVALGAFAAISTVREHGDGASAAGVRSIAVLPFADMSEKRDQEYFADGISEEVRNRLAQLTGLKVSARTASFVYKGANVSLEEIGRDLDVEAVLEGSVRREGNQIRVTAQLIDARTMKNLWTQRYDRELSSVFALQDEIAADIVAAIKLQLTPVTVAQNELSGSSNPRASEAYLQALHFFNRRTDADLRKAAELFEKAVSEDQQFAAAYAILAQTYALLPTVGDYPVFDAVAKGQAAAARAVGLNASQAEAYSALGQIRQNFEWDFESADRHYRNAIRFNNGYATAHQWRAEALLFLGDYDASRTEIDLALDLDPASAPAQHVKAYQHLTRKEFAAASRILDRLLATHPEYLPALLSRGTVALLEGEYALAENILLRAAGDDAALRAALRAVVGAAANPGQRAQAVSAVAALEQRRSPSELALWYALIGEKEKALEQMQSAYESGADARLPFMLLHPAFDGIRERAQYQQILEELHMVPEGDR